MNNKDIIEKIKLLKKNLNAGILVHYYQNKEIQDIADYLGDSLGLSRQAKKTNADTIIFCGVQFMAETASIICPEKKVLLPELEAGCPMADMITAQELVNLKSKYKDQEIEVVCYVNSTAAVKAESSICCTSSNAVKVVQSLSKNKRIIFVPDKYLASYTEKITKRKIIKWHGYCRTHIRIQPEDINKIKEKYKNAIILAHPECTLEVQDIADVITSTGGMVNYIKESNNKEFVIATEPGLLDYLRKHFKNKLFLHPDDKIICPNMKMITLEKVLWCMEDQSNEIKVPYKIAEKARLSIERMLKI